jgi:lactoylglutathione lyase
MRSEIAHSLRETVDRPTPGLAHFAISVGSKEAVRQVSNRLSSDGYEVLDGPRSTGDGFYECVILDPEGNRVEVTV